MSNGKKWDAGLVLVGGHDRVGELKKLFKDSVPDIPVFELQNQMELKDIDGIKFKELDVLLVVILDAEKGERMENIDIVRDFFESVPCLTWIFRPTPGDGSDFELSPDLWEKETLITGYGTMSSTELSGALVDLIEVMELTNSSRALITLSPENIHKQFRGVEKLRLVTDQSSVVGMPEGIYSRCLILIKGEELSLEDLRGELDRAAISCRSDAVILFGLTGRGCDPVGDNPSCTMIMGR